MCVPLSSQIIRCGPEFAPFPASITRMLIKHTVGCVVCKLNLASWTVQLTEHINFNNQRFFFGRLVLGERYPQEFRWKVSVKPFGEGHSQKHPKPICDQISLKIISATPSFGFHVGKTHSSSLNLRLLSVRLNSKLWRHLLFATLQSKLQNGVCFQWKFASRKRLACWTNRVWGYQTRFQQIDFGWATLVSLTSIDRWFNWAWHASLNWTVWL